MIERNELLIAGKLLKSHGIKGEIIFQSDIPTLDVEDVPYLVCNIDGIFTPFFIENVRNKSNTTYIIKIQGIDSEEKAKRMSGYEVYFSKEIAKEQKSDESSFFSWNNLIGYTIADAEKGILGTIKELDDSTVNILFNIETPSGDELLIPANEDFIVDIDSEEQEITMNLPEGLTEL